MINSLAILGGLLAAIEISVSPDQPLAYSYVDDPLIVEVRSDTPMVADIQVTLDPAAGGEATQQVFPATSLGPEINRWCAIKDLPPIRGRWDITVHAGAGDNAPAHQVSVYRIDRPAGAYEHPVFAVGAALNRESLLALRSASVNLVRIPASHPEITQVLAALERLGMKAIVLLESAAEAPATAAELGTGFCGTIARWEITATPETAAGLAPTIEALQGLSCSLPVSLGVGGPDGLEEILAPLDTGLVDHLVVQAGAEGATVLDGIRAELAALGVEAPVLEYIYTGSDATALLPVYFEALARGAQRVGFPAHLVMDGDTLQSGLAYANALAHGIAPAKFAGSVEQDGATRARVFAEGQAWTLAFWNEDGPGELSLPWQEDPPYRLLDGWSNLQEIAAPEDNPWTHPAGPEIQFVQGTGGPVLKAALVQEAEQAAAHLLDSEQLAAVWTETTRETLAAVDDAPINDQSRVHFFALLRAFPEIEERWHSGEITRPAAVTALAGLADLARTLCRLEAARGATFLEPLQDTLARCEEYQSAYLTGSTTTPQARERGDWLVREVRRLMDQVESLQAAGAKIEADAVAALAEWRARALEHAVKAGPLSDRMTLPADGASNEEGNEDR